MSPAAAQECRADGSAALASLALVRTPLANGGHVTGLEAGIGGAHAVGGTALAGTLFGTVGEGRGRPIGVRLRLERPLLQVGGFTLCGGLLAGGSTVRAGEDGAWTAAGGVLVGASRRLSTRRLTIAPWVGARGLGARTTGEILDEEFVTTGLSLGVEAGVGVSGDRVMGALQVTADGFDAGLGATPYPALAVRLVAGWRL